MLARRELIKLYKSHKQYCTVCGMALLVENGVLGDYFVLDKEGQYYCTACEDKTFELGDERIFEIEFAS